MGFISHAFSTYFFPFITLFGLLFGNPQPAQLPSATSSVAIHASTSLRAASTKTPSASENKIQSTKTDNVETSQVNPPPTTPNFSEPTTTSAPTPTPTPTPPQNSTLCNGTYYSACPSGENFVCPPSGNAYCETNQQVQADNQKAAALASYESELQTYNSDIAQYQNEIANVQTESNQSCSAMMNNPSQALGQQGVQIEYEAEVCNSYEQEIGNIEKAENQILQEETSVKNEILYIESLPN